MIQAPRLSDALARHGHMIHLAIPSEFKRAYAYPIRGDFHDPAITAERERREAEAFAVNVDAAAENRAFAESQRDRLARTGRPEAAAEWAGWATFFRDLQQHQEMRRAA